jgi:hypothetical protein
MYRTLKEAQSFWLSEKKEKKEKTLYPTLKEAGELLTVNTLEKGIHFTLGHVLNAPGHVTVIVCGAV